MNRLYILLIVTAFLGLGLAAQPPSARGGNPVSSTVNPDNGRIFAIVVGVSRYATLPKLNYADTDAVYFYNYLRSTVKKEDRDKISLFLNKDADRDLITEKLYSISDSIRKGDKVFIYFGGHGDIEHVIQTDNCLLLLADAPEKNYLRKASSYLDINLFRDFFSNWSSKEVRTIFVCDACHSGKLSGGDAGRKNTMLSLQQSWQNEVRMLSCQPEELSLEGKQYGGGRGLFSFYLLAGLQGVADKNKDNAVTVFELQKFVTDSVTTYSELSQTPAISGDVKAVVGRYDGQMVAAARAMLGGKKITGVNGENSLAFKGNEIPDIEKTITDSVRLKEFRLFLRALRDHQLTGTDQGNACARFMSFPQSEDLRVARGYMKLQLLAALQSDFEQLAEYLYNDKYDAFDFGRRYEIEKYIKAALKVTGENHHLYKRLKAKELFLFSCNSLPQIQKGVILRGQLMEQIQVGIDSLKKAISYDPMAPYLYLRLGDFYLYSGQYEDCIVAYNKYMQLLPNDEYAYNKLGMGYYYSGNNSSAIAMFRKSLSINPVYVSARENLEIALRKK